MPIDIQYSVNINKMKNIIKLTYFILPFTIHAQVAIGKSSITNNNPSISLEFGDYVVNGRGIIVPWVISAGDVADAEKGTIIFDTSDKIMKYKKHDGTWFHLSKNEVTTVEGNINYDTTGMVNTSFQDTYNGMVITENINAKTSIGIPTATPGILVLEDTDKAMVLPKVPNPHLNIVNPESGTMVFDTVNKQLAIYNGKVWSFWKP